MSEKRLRQMAIYGKGSIGKSIIACNVSIGLSQRGFKVLQVGCSPKSDSTAFLLGGSLVKNEILTFSRDRGLDENLIFECVDKGYNDIYCAESGGPDPGAGCAGRGVAMALSELKKYQVFTKLDLDFVVYDAIADVVCGGFGQPMREGYAEEVYLVTSGELMSTYSANNICRAVRTVAEAGANTRIGGLIVNMRGVNHEAELVTEFAARIGVPVIGMIPRSEMVQMAEAKGGTVMQFYPDSDLGKLYSDLAGRILENTERVLPTPITLEEITELARKHEAYVA